MVKKLPFFTTPKLLGKSTFQECLNFMTLPLVRTLRKTEKVKVTNANYITWRHGLPLFYDTAILKYSKARNPREFFHPSYGESLRRWEAKP